MARRVLAIDVKEDAVAAILVKSGFKSRDIEAYAYIPRGKGIDSALEGITRSMDIDGAECVVSLPASQVSFRNLTVPFDHPKKIKQILPAEIEQSLPLPVEDIAFDFQRIESADAGGQTSIFTALIEKSILDGYLDSLSNFKLRPEHITCDGYALAHRVSRLPDFPSMGLVVEGGQGRATLVLIAFGTIRLIRSVCVDPLARSASLCSRILWTVQAFEEMSGLTLQPEAVFVTGFGFDDETLLKEMTGILKIPVHPVNILDPTGARVKRAIAAGWNPLQFDSALCLATLEFNGTTGIDFKSGGSDQPSFWGEYSKSIIKTGVLAGLVLSLAGAELFFDLYTLGRQVRRLDHHIESVFRSTFPDVKRIVDPVHQMRGMIEDAKKSAYLQGETENKIFTIDLLNEISRLIPVTIDVELTRLVISPENVLIDGNTDTFNTVDDIKNRLDSARLFSGVTISSANIDRAENRVRFKLKGAF